MSNPLADLNPVEAKMQIGIKKKYVITIYPLSFGDEVEMLELLKVAFIAYLSLPPEQQTDIALLSLAVEFVKTNLPQIIDLVVDQDEWKELAGETSLIKSISNKQLIELAQAIYQMNFGDEVQKKAQEMATNFQGMMKMRVGETPLTPVNGPPS